MEREVLTGWCIRFGGDGLPLLEECQVEKLNEGQYLRSRVRGGHDAMQAQDFFMDKLAALGRQRKHLVRLGEGHRRVVDEINRRVLMLDLELVEGEKNAG